MGRMVWVSGVQERQVSGGVGDPWRGWQVPKLDVSAGPELIEVPVSILLSLL